jgi:hypothetical protein
MRSAIVLLTVTALLAACSGTKAQVKFQPEFLPVEFGLDTDGKFSVDKDIYSYVTPLGRVSINVGVEKEIRESTTRLVIRRQGSSQEDVYDLSLTDSLAVCTNGRSEIVPKFPTITVTAYDDTTRIGVIDSSKISCGDVYSQAKQGNEQDANGQEDDPPPTRSGTITIAEGHSVILDTNSPNWNTNRGCGDCSLWFQGELSPGSELAHSACAGVRAGSTS